MTVDNGNSIQRGEARFRAHPEVLARELDDGVVVLVHLETNRIFTLNPTGGRIWEMLTGGTSRDDIERELQRDYDGPPDRIGQDVTTLVEKLVGEQLLVAAAGPQQGTH